MTISVLKPLRAGLAAAVTIALVAAGSAEAADKVVSLDWATYNPLSVLIKSKGLMEQEFAKDGTTVKWTQSTGSNLAVAGLNAKTLDFGSTAGSATLLGRVNGGEFRAVYAYSKPEWAALTTLKNSPINAVADLKGKRVACAKGTDPYVFAVQAIKKAGLDAKDVKLVLLQHADGRRALESGEVDAWVGLDPMMADLELNGGGRLFFRNADANTYGVLNVREEIAKTQPDVVKRVLAVYEKARAMAKENPTELKAALVAAAGLPEAVIARQLERTDFSGNGSLAGAPQTIIQRAGKILQDAGVIPPDVDVAKTVTAMIDTSFTK
ncbi:MAG: aliphatic sulfonate ABC transporter substrate-binding protein [Magnetospirillum sp.]|nr:aliphatic sulfonate ABC transporter substrate-binding protein [Magnetospirillum sp.]